ncbi:MULTISPECIES: nitrite/sulfite reductase [Streptomyces]|uniref:assimilatory sulfite reductase (ferredoxin) n=2 Tax=Streptomyces rimosus subsp. rimosus TaxID=132474 RepID=L8ELZ3_STRR1|nr:MULTISPECIES: nitrite/sulfite reductase [Streptomyces]KOG74683.1 sulfite reductase [Kitasatospora aureofaciens]MYT44960.1 nitrite/sulfite reductase [Streptomyces sp. SID5471]KOT29665.1 sulfite reductase [Streptomyces rimosus subsp. rimosus]KOT36185.1 sulfite reductase [Streptomyces sp. NRRL WC-3701]KOT53639.1 sulfite reductase [Streptomyces rimosus subsp. rimosus]
MAATSDRPSPATTRRKAGRHRGEGQWAVGHFTPLNGNEQFKKDDDGLNVRTRIETVYAKTGFASIDPNDLRGRMRWWGLYTQRKPGIDGGKTAVLEPEELEDEYFMLRVRVDGGRLSVAQLRAIGEVSQEYARGTADITDRQNIQLHWVRIEDVPAIWRKLESVGLSTTEACGDCPRVIIGSPVAGIAADEIIDGSPAIAEIERRFIGSKEFSNLPRKFKTAISGSPVQDVVHEINDVAFVGVEHPEHGPGFDLWVGGGLSTNPRLGERLGAWVPLAEVPDAWAGVVGIFRDYGYRRLRNRARLKFLMADWGPEKFRQVLEDEYLKRKLIDGPAPAEPSSRWRDHIGVHRQKDGRFYVGFAPRVGRVDGATLVKVAELAAAHGSDRLNTTVEQKMIILDVAEEQVEPLVAGLEALDFQVRPSPFRRGTMACTGIEFCKLAIVETKGRGAALIDELERRMPDFEEPITINLNGCPNACARIQTADIGLKGQLVLDEDGNQVEGYQVHLGGALGLQAGFGRKVRGLKVTAAELPDYVERVLTNFQEQREVGERFATWAARADEGALK